MDTAWDESDTVASVPATVVQVVVDGMSVFAHSLSRSESGDLAGCQVILAVGGQHMRICRAGFSLIELLVVITIIAILTGMLTMAIGQVRTAAKAAVCANQLRNLGAAEASYTTDWEGQLMATAVKDSSGVIQTLWYGPASGAWNSDDFAMREQFGSREEFRRLVRCPAQSEPKTLPLVWVLSSYGRNGYLGLPPVLDPPPANQFERWVPVGAISGASELMTMSDSTCIAPYNFMGVIWEWATPTRIDYRHLGGANVLFVDGHVGKARRSTLRINQLIWFGAPAASTFD